MIFVHFAVLSAQSKNTKLSDAGDVKINKSVQLYIPTLGRFGVCLVLTTFPHRYRVIYNKYSKLQQAIEKLELKRSNYTYSQF